MSLITVYTQRDKIIVISDGRETEIIEGELKILTDNADKVLISEEGFVVAKAGLSVLGTLKYGDIYMSDIVDHFIEMNRRNLNLSAEDFIKGLVETVKRTIKESLNMDYRTERFNLAYIVAKWTNGYPDIVSYHSHFNTGEYIDRFESVSFLIKNSALIGKCGDVKTIIEHRNIDIEDYSLEEGIQLVLSLFSKVETQEPTVGGNKKIYILDKDAESSNLHTYTESI